MQKKHLCKAYNAYAYIFKHKHECCDVCEKTCTCLECPVKETFIRNGSDDDRTILRHKLELLQSNLPKLFGDKSEISPVTIKGLIDNCDRIFTISEAVEYGMI